MQNDFEISLDSFVSRGNIFPDCIVSVCFIVQLILLIINCGIDQMIYDGQFSFVPVETFSSEPKKMLLLAHKQRNSISLFEEMKTSRQLFERKFSAVKKNLTISLCTFVCSESSMKKEIIATKRYFFLFSGVVDSYTNFRTPKPFIYFLNIS